jgi:cold shock CspA family protein
MADVKRGRVKKVLWDEARGEIFGFIECQSVASDVWFASVAVKGMSPAPGDTVAFILSSGERPRALEVWRI